MGTFAVDRSNAFGWAGLNARGLERAIPFYEWIFGWSHSTTEGGGDSPDYTQFETDGEQIAGAFEDGCRDPGRGAELLDDLLQGG